MRISIIFIMLNISRFSLFCATYLFLSVFLLMLDFFSNDVDIGTIQSLCCPPTRLAIGSGLYIYYRLVGFFYSMLVTSLEGAVAIARDACVYMSLVRYNTIPTLCCHFLFLIRVAPLYFVDMIINICGRLVNVASLGWKGMEVMRSGFMVDFLWTLWVRNEEQRWVKVKGTRHQNGRHIGDADFCLIKKRSVRIYNEDWLLWYQKSSE
ncbi:hypothetical protein GYMLUDRAFT_371905 [Collybiopsis luxurians FD-317 M1]|uniref:Uncharacterized protein n=1 Tax=Collybiopsis luxurians FD-317 M1 TaxID=944289 RepID=A0A0D0AP76_9AGAR|nr:hypothetical protein GYMLUDRAFT_371905 [Collybiopsis luxurians FD-317 M1]